MERIWKEVPCIAMSWAVSKRLGIGIRGCFSVEISCVIGKQNVSF